jgi:hypothetical protein
VLLRALMIEAVRFGLIGTRRRLRDGSRCAVFA